MLPDTRAVLLTLFLALGQSLIHLWIAGAEESTRHLGYQLLIVLASGGAAHVAVGQPQYHPRHGRTR